MFEVAELGRKVPKKTFAEEEPKLHTALLKAQRALSQAKLPVIVIVSGVEAAGKGDVVSLLHRWLDTRGIQTHAFWDETDEERERPRYWRFWRAMPPRGLDGDHVRLLVHGTHHRPCLPPVERDGARPRAFPHPGLRAPAHG